MDKRWIYGLGVIGAITAIGFSVKAYNKQQQEKKDKAFNEFRTNLENTTEPEKINKAVLSSAFNPTFWKEIAAKGKRVVGEKTALELAKKISAAWNAGTFWDDLEEEVYRAFEDHRLQTFADVSRVADAYQSSKVEGKDLWKHLNAKLSTAEFAKVKSIVIKKIAQ
ncbi:MAG: hypothetical protein RJQ00_06455 [Vicingaceae bacterium]